MENDRSKTNTSNMNKLILFFVLATLVAPAVAQTRETRDVDSFTEINFRFPGKLYLKQGSPQKVVLEGDKAILEEVETEVDGDRLIIGKTRDWFEWKWDDDDRITVYITVPEINALSVSGSGDLIGESEITGDDIDLSVSGSGSLSVELALAGDLEADVSGSGGIEMKGKCRSVDSDVSGSGRVNLDATISELADFGVSGSGRIEARGSAPEVKTSISGSGKVLAADLETNSCEIRISGSGDVEVNVRNELDATISGSGTVSYRGDPRKVNSHSSGSGTVKKM